MLKETSGVLNRIQNTRSYRLTQHYYFNVLFPFLMFNPTTKWISLAFVPGMGYNAYQFVRNRMQADNSERAICLFSENAINSYFSVFAGVKGQMAKFFTENGVRVDFKHGATKQDFLDALEDETYQHMAIVGQGRTRWWSVRRGESVFDSRRVDITTAGIEEFMADRPRKSGYFLQYICGSVEDTPIGAHVVDDPENVLCFPHRIREHDKLAGLRKPNMGLQSILTDNQ